MMSGEAWLFLLSVLINAVNLFLQVFFTIMYSDLEWYGIPRYRSRRPTHARKEMRLIDGLSVTHG
jgi:hypothetical protein